MEGWRQGRLGSRAGTHREKEKNKNIHAGKEKRKTYLTLTGLLMEGLAPDCPFQMALILSGLVGPFPRFAFDVHEFARQIGGRT